MKNPASASCNESISRLAKAKEKTVLVEAKGWGEKVSFLMCRGR